MPPDPPAAPLRRTGTAIRVSRPVRDRLAQLAAAKAARENRRVPVNEIIEDLLRRRGSK